MAEAEPVEIEEAMKSQVWVKAMQEELDMIEKNQTWMLVDRPANKKTIGIRAIRIFEGIV